MPVQFRFDKLTITDFRGIHALQVALPDDFALHLIGSNNAGKSTILEAIAFALRGGGFHQYDLVPFDFFRAAGGDPAREFEICLTLKAEKRDNATGCAGCGGTGIRTRSASEGYDIQIRTHGEELQSSGRQGETHQL
jgi:putative ATP-dependent endonuclease of the OLD family